MVKALFDHNMSPYIARALDLIVSQQGHEAWALKDKFNVKISDIELFTQLGKEKNWIVVSKDRNQAKRKPERHAILNSGVIAFYLSSDVGKQRINEQAATILWQWDKLVVQRENNQNGLFVLPVNKGTRFRAL